jgi:hypothetical protein
VPSPSSTRLQADSPFPAAWFAAGTNANENEAPGLVLGAEGREHAPAPGAKSQTGLTPGEARSGASVSDQSGRRMCWFFQLLAVWISSALL